MIRLALPIALLLTGALPAMAQSVPTELGKCVKTTIAEIATRLEGVPDSGDVVIYANDIVGISYDEVPQLRVSRVGDPVKLCLTSIPEDCPPGDDRGKFYSAHNGRTGQDWEMPDAGHMCGGA